MKYLLSKTGVLVPASLSTWRCAKNAPAVHTPSKVLTRDGVPWSGNRKGVGGLVRPRSGAIQLGRGARVNPLQRNAWGVTVPPSGPTYPNMPGGLTPFGQFTGSPREDGSNHAFGFSWLGQWFWESGSRTEDQSLIVTADVTNLTGSGNVLRTIWTPGTVGSIKSAKTDPATLPATYDTLYIMLRVYWETDTWDNTGHKFFYVGLPTSDKHVYVTRDLSGAGKMTTEGYAGAAGNIINLPTGTFVDGSWHSMEFVFQSVGMADWYLNGSLIGSASGVDWNGSGFGTFEYYATNNAIPDVKHYRIGELYMAGA